MHLEIIPHGRPLTNVTRERVIDSMAEISININESNQNNPRYNTNTGRLWIHIISQIFQYFAISATTLYAFDHLDERENLPMQVLVGTRTSAIVILDQTTQQVRNFLTDAFRFISRRVARADGSTIFFLDDLYNHDLGGEDCTIEMIFNYLDQVLDNETMNYLRANDIRGYVFTIKPSYG